MTSPAEYGQYQSPEHAQSTPPVEVKRQTSATTKGITALTIAVICLFLTSLLPSGFVIRQPGPVVNTLGEVKTADGKSVPLIEVPAGTPTYQTEGTLSLTTVQVVGNRETTPNWFQLLGAWFDSSKAVRPLDEAYPPQQTQEQREQQDEVMMTTSQHDAAAAALIALDYKIPLRAMVGSVSAGSPAEGILKPGDFINTVDSQPVKDALSMRAVLNAAGGKPVTVNITRGTETMDVSVTPQQGVVDGEKLWLVGVGVGQSYQLPIDIKIQLDNIGGPSAGMMFALGIIDTLTPGELNGGKQIAGTGTITPAGDVGPIGGIRQKLYGARDAGAKYFLAPDQNCNEVAGHVPDGLQVVKVSTLKEAKAAVETIATGTKQDVAKLATCSAK